MKVIRSLTLISSIAICLINLASCTGNNKPVALTISAAASLKESLEEVQEIYTKDHENIYLNYNLGASGALQQQIEQGAPVDIFISASSKQMDALQQKSLLITETRKNLIKNKIVLIAPKESTAISDFKDLGSDRVKKVALGQPESVPIGKYAQEVLTFFKISDKVKPKAIFAKDVRQVLNYVERGETDAGIVYSTDAIGSGKVKIVAIAPDNSHSPVIYPVAVIKDSKNIPESKEFVEFLASEQAEAVFAKYGFTIIAGE